MTDLPPLPSSREGWQTLGELEVPVDSDKDDALHAWLSALLAPLRLHADVLNRVLRSVQESTARAAQPNTGMAFDHIHFSIFAPDPRLRKGKTWNFFRIEKPNELEQIHLVEVYLYLEGPASGVQQLAR